MSGDICVIVEEVRLAGFRFAPAEQFRALLTPAALAEWPSFAASWDDLGLDTYMADGGRYRCRRFAAFAVSSESVVRKAHQPPYQSRDYNPLNGGIERWFGPVTEAITVHPVTLGILDIGRQVFDALTPAPDRPQAWSAVTFSRPVSGVAQQKSRRLENALQRPDPKTGLETASTRPAKGAETPSGSGSRLSGAARSQGETGQLLAEITARGSRPQASLNLGPERRKSRSHAAGDANMRARNINRRHG